MTDPKKYTLDRALTEITIKFLQDYLATAPFLGSHTPVPEVKSPWLVEAENAAHRAGSQFPKEKP